MEARKRFRPKSDSPPADVLPPIPLFTAEDSSTHTPAPSGASQAPMATLTSPAVVLSGVYAPTPSPTDDARSQLRALAENALAQQQYKIALFYADKLASLSKFAESDVLLLCRLYYMNKEYNRALHVMEARGLCSSPDADHVVFRALTAQCLAETGRWDQVLEALEEFLDLFEPVQGIIQFSSQFPHSSGASINVVSILCLLRGIAHIHQSNTAKAALWLKNSLYADLYNCEAFDQIVELQLLSSVEERQLFESLPFQPRDALIQQLYASKLNKYDTSTSVAERFDVLESSSGLGQNADVLSVKAEVCYYQCDITTAYRLTKSIYSLDPFHRNNCIVHVATLIALDKAAELYRLAHKLVDGLPEDALAWYAVGCYYLCIHKGALARRYFSKATNLNPRFAHAWLGLGNACAAQDETDQAMAAYRTANRLFPGCHLPLVCMAMESQRQKNTSLAEQYLAQAHAMCPWDPLIANELGVLKYKENDFEAAMAHFEDVMDLVKDLPMMQKVRWEPTMCNLAHTYRKLGFYDKAIQLYDSCLSLLPNQSGTLSALGFTWHLLGNLDKAVHYYHMAVGVCPDDTFTQQMLRKALASLVDVDLETLLGEEAASASRSDMSLGQMDVSGGMPPRGPPSTGIRKTPGVPAFLLRTPLPEPRFTPGSMPPPAPPVSARSAPPPPSASMSEIYVDMVADDSTRSSQFMTPEGIQPSPIFGEGPGSSFLADESGRGFDDGDGSMDVGED